MPLTRSTGIDVLGSVPWGTHICHLYDTKEDLVNVLVPYFKAGLQHNELCVWVTSEPLGAQEARKALSRAARKLNAFMAAGQIETLDYTEWYPKTGGFNGRQVINAWMEKTNEAVARGFDGVRAAGNMSWVEQGAWGELINYEDEIENSISKLRMIAICSYCAGSCTPAQIARLVCNHRLTLIRSGDACQVVESEERKRTEQELWASREFNSRLLVNYPNPVLVSNIDTVIQYVNPALEKQTGFAMWELLGTREPYPWCTEETRHKVHRLIEEAISPRGMTYEDIFCMKSGGYFWVEVTLTPIRWNSEIGYYLETWVDITDRIKAKVKLEEYRQHLEELVEKRTTELTNINEQLNLEISERRAVQDRFTRLFTSSKDAIGWANRDGTLLDVNNAFCKLTGYSKKDLLSKRYQEITPEEYHKYEAKILKRLYRTGEPEEYEKEYIRKDRNRVPISLTAFIVGGVHDRPISVAAVIKDITNRKEAERKLHKSYEHEKKLRQQLEAEMRKRAEFTRTLAHELKTPLTPVMLSSQELVATLKDETSLRLAKNISRGASNLSSRIDELLDLAKAEIGMLKLKREYIDVVELLQDIVGEVSAIARSRGQKLIWEPPAALPQVWADKIRVRQIVLNLLNNAFRFTPKQTRIAIKAKKDGCNLVIEVSDNGPGIKEEHQKRLFKPYDRLEVERERLSGLGLGLALCKTLAELHGGRIWLKSHPGKGSTFGFSLPLGGP